MRWSHNNELKWNRRNYAKTIVWWWNKSGVESLSYRIHYIMFRHSEGRKVIYFIWIPADCWKTQNLRKCKCMQPNKKQLPWKMKKEKEEVEKKEIRCQVSRLYASLPLNWFILFDCTIIAAASHWSRSLNFENIFEFNSSTEIV